jgi:site-specific DNA-methyltransferase (cytosine-N4-specific)
VRKVRIEHQDSTGKYLVGDVEAALSSPLLEELKGRVNLILTSPPFPLNHKKSYGNLSGDEYLAWIERLAPKLSSLLAPDGSIVIEIGNSWEPRRPVQSLLHLKALMAFVEAPSAQLRLCQQFVCYNPSRLPSPAQWVTVERARVTDSFTHVWWMARTDHPKADNKKVLRPYSQDMRKLLSSRKYNGGHRPSQHYIGAKSFLKNNGGSIAHNLFEMASLDTNREVRLPNVFSFSNNASNDHYSKTCQRKKIKPHPARMPAGLATFFVEFLTEPGDLVLDPFAGSNTTGAIAASLGRKWISIDAEAKYAKHSKIRLSSIKIKRTKSARGTKRGTQHERQHRREANSGRSVRA